MASENSADGMTLKKMERHSRDDEDDSHDSEAQQDIFATKHGLTEEDSGCLSDVADKNGLCIGQGKGQEDQFVARLGDVEGLKF